LIIAGEIVRVVSILLVLVYMPLLFVRREHLSKDHRLYTAGVFFVLVSVAGSAVQLLQKPLTFWAVVRLVGMVVIIWASLRGERHDRVGGDRTDTGGDLASDS
jgi:hypothetical protein